MTRRRVAWTVGLAAAFLLLTPMLTYAWFAQDIADKERLMNRNSTGVIMRDRNGAVFYRQGQLSDGEDITLAQISDYMESALIASEDRDFRQHEGYSLRGIAVAVYSNVLNRDATRYGGSTITQQLVKNKLLTSEKSFLRKYQEVSLAVAIERRYTKDEILEMYLNSVYFGEGAFGISEAAKRYYGKDAASLDLAESSMLVGILPAPSALSPISGDAERARKAQARVLGDMQEAGVILAAEGQAAGARPLAYNSAPGSDGNAHGQHFAMMVLEDLTERYGEEAVVRGGFDVTTTLDLAQQKVAEASARQQVARLGAGGARNAGIVAIDPRSGEVRALVGSVDWNDPTFGKVNMATSARQPGSSFKPLFYAEALDKRLITPSTMLEDRQKTYGGSYAPTNYDFRYRGQVTTRSALALSMNIPAVEVMQKLGVDESAAAARRMGVSTVTEPDKYGLSLALGTAEVKLYEMTNAYAAFANRGEQYSPTKYTSVKNKYGDELFQAAPPSGRRVISPEAAHLVSSILADNQARAATFGNSLTVPGRQVAVKTGTTNDNKDAWTIGYTPSLAVGVWMGNNENEPMRGLAGSSSAGIVWRDVMTKSLVNLPNETFTRPSGVVSMRVCTANGLRAASGDGEATYEEVFIRGSEPSGTCNQPKPKEDDKRDEPKPEEEEKKVDKPEDEGTPIEEELPREELPGVPGDGDNSGPGGRGGGTPQPQPAPAPAPVEPQDSTVDTTIRTPRPARQPNE